MHTHDTHELTWRLRCVWWVRVCVYCVCVLCVCVYCVCVCVLCVCWVWSLIRALSTQIWVMLMITHTVSSQPTNIGVC